MQDLTKMYECASFSLLYHFEFDLLTFGAVYQTKHDIFKDVSKLSDTIFFIL